MLYNSHAVLLIPTYPIFAQLEGICTSCTRQARWNQTFPLFLSLAAFLSVFLFFHRVYYSSKNWSKVNLHHVRVCCTYLCISAFVQLSFLAAKAEDIQSGLHLLCLILRRGSCTVSPPSSKGGICDLISPGNIKEKPCFIHRHKAPEFTQIKFARLCLRDQAWGLTHIEMIGFLRLI